MRMQRKGLDTMTETKPNRLSKSEFLRHLVDLDKAGPQPLKPRPMAYKHSGSSYAEDGIRITGSRKFIDSVLSRLGDLLEYEAIQTRLDVNYSEQTAKRKGDDGRTVFTGQGTGDWVCYIKVAQRGNDAQMAHAFCAAFSELA